MAVHHVEDSMQSKNFTFKCHRDGSDVYAVNSIVFHPQCVPYLLHCSIHDSSRVFSECTTTGFTFIPSTLSQRYSSTWILGLAAW